MIAIILLIIFLFVGWITLMIPLSDSNSIQMILAIAMGLVAVNIVSFSIIIHKLDCLQKKSKNNKIEEKKTSETDSIS